MLKIIENYMSYNQKKLKMGSNVNTNVHDLMNINNNPLKPALIKRSKDYWEDRYAHGGNSGSGSYNHLAKFKASVINDFVKKNNISTVIEWGSGDCNQLKLANYKNYIGYDVSQTAVKICKKKFYNDSTKEFNYLSDNFKNNKKADLSLSLEVIFHIIEDNAFDLYMNNLFNSSKKYVIIYSSNIDSRRSKSGKYVKHRKFTEWINRYVSNDWKFIKFIPNKYPIKSKFNGAKSYSDFYIYKKLNFNDD